MYRRWSLARQFLLASLLVLLISGLGMGYWIGRQIETSVLHDASAYTALYVDSIVSPYLQGLATDRRLPENDVAALQRLLNEQTLKEQIVAIKVWTVDGEVVFSPNKQLIGRRFGIDEELAQAVNGQVTTNISDLSDPENEFERQHWSRLQSSYVPVRAERGGQVIGVTEFYQLPDRLDREVGAARLQAWSVVAVLTLATYLTLAGIVGRGSRTIIEQQQELNDKVTELSMLLDQNQRLHDRVRQAGARTTALNEQSLRRISADLHDGPGQALALALLRIDAVDEHGVDRDVAVVHGAIQDALQEIRAISAGLRLPELEDFAVREAVERVVRDHQRRSGTAVALQIAAIPERAPLPVMIALYRTLQEALSNATRHGKGRDVAVRVWQDRAQLCVTVSDGGPGVALLTAQSNGDQHLGIEGMRERTQLLGGEFKLCSQPGRGTTVKVCWPLEPVEDVWTESHNIGAAVT